MNDGDRIFFIKTGFFKFFHIFTATTVNIEFTAFCSPVLVVKVAQDQ